MGLHLLATQVRLSWLAQLGVHLLAPLRLATVTRLRHTTATVLTLRWTPPSPSSCPTSPGCLDLPMQVLVTNVSVRQSVQSLSSCQKAGSKPPLYTAFPSPWPPSLPGPCTTLSPRLTTLWFKHSPTSRNSSTQSCTPEELSELAKQLQDYSMLTQLSGSPMPAPSPRPV